MCLYVVHTGSPTSSSIFIGCVTELSLVDLNVINLLKLFKVLNFDNNYSGLILLVGQVADGLSTTFVGGLSDRPDGFILCR